MARGIHSTGAVKSKVNVHLAYEPIGARPLLGERANPNLAPSQQAVRNPLIPAVSYTLTLHHLAKPADNPYL